MFILAGKPLSPDVAFTDVNDIQRPANWLRLASPQERLEAGITEEPDPPVYDQRFYWGYDDGGALIPKDHAQLVEQWTAQTRQSANTLLAPTDWLIIREADNGTAADPAIKTWREDLRLACAQKVSALEATADTDALAAYVTGTEYGACPADPRLTPPAPPAPPAGE